MPLLPPKLNLGFQPRQTSLLPMPRQPTTASHRPCHAAPTIVATLAVAAQPTHATLASCRMRPLAIADFSTLHRTGLLLPLPYCVGYSTSARANHGSVGSDRIWPTVPIGFGLLLSLSRPSLLALTPRCLAAFT